MKYSALHTPWTVHAGSLLTAALVACLTIPSALAKKPDHAGGGGGDDGGGDGGSGWEDTAVINDVPPVVTSPVQYQSIEILWPVENHNGLSLNGINRDGFVVAFGKLPADPGVEPERRGLINRNPDGSPGSTFADLKHVFANALNTLNGTRSDGPWRIAYARGITDAGLIVCQLIPEGVPRIYDTGDANFYGVEATPSLIAVVDLNQTESSEALVVVDPMTDPDWVDAQITPSGHVLAFGPELGGPNSSTHRERLLYLRSVDESGVVSYSPLTIPQVSGPVPGITDSLVLAQTEWDVPTEGTDQLVRYSADTEVSKVLWESVGKSLWASGIAEDGTIYVDQFYTVTSGKGRNRVTESFSTPFHVLPDAGEGGERTPLTSETEYGNIHNWNNYVSRASLPGEEEVVVYVRDANGLETMQIYKPKFGARFVTPIPVGSRYAVRIASPYYGEVASTPHDDSEPFYNGGYVAYGEGSRVVLLTPQPVQ